MELIRQSAFGADLLFCCFWHADSWVADNIDIAPEALPLQTRQRLVTCGYCAWCGQRLPAADCPMCRSGTTCADSAWRMRSVALEFSRELRRLGVRVTPGLLDAGEERSKEDPAASGSELAQFVLLNRRLAAAPDDGDRRSA